MNYRFWTYAILLLISKLDLICEAKRSYYSVLNLKIESLKFNNSSISFCVTNSSDQCVKTVYMQLGTKTISITDVTIHKTFMVETDDLLQITSSIEYNIKPNSTVANSTNNPLLHSNITKITLEFIPTNFAINVGLMIQCQDGFIGDRCNEINLCQRLPSNMCRNNGSCSQEKGNVTCKCAAGFTGDFCHDPVNPCQDHLCGNNSTCVQNNRTRLQYSCRCQVGYWGELCYQQFDPCMDNLCNNNATCLSDEKEKLKYRCDCRDGYTGRFCAQTIDNCAKNSSLCSHFTNATCVSTKEGHLCYCDGGCTIPQVPSLPFKWPFNELVTFLFVVLEAIVILMLIVLIIILKSRCCQPSRKRGKYTFDDKLLSGNGHNLSHECLEFGPSYVRQPNVHEDIDNRNTLNPIYDTNELQSFGNNHLNLENSGMSTFGRR